MRELADVIMDAIDVYISANKGITVGAALCALGAVITSFISISIPSDEQKETAKVITDKIIHVVGIRFPKEEGK
jgi:hypothetical protein